MSSLLAAKPLDFDPASNVRITDISSSLSQGKVQPLLSAGALGGAFTAEHFRENARQAKFMLNFTSMDFDDLQPVEQENGDTWHVGAQAIDGIDYHVHISEYELLASMSLDEATEETIAEYAKKYDIAKKSTYVEIDGKRYFTKMQIPINFGSAGSNKILLNAGVFLVGDGIATAILAAAIKNIAGKTLEAAAKQAIKSITGVIGGFLRGTLTAAWRFLTTFVGGIFSGEFSGLLSRSAAAAGTAWRAAFAALETVEVVLGAVGVLLAIAGALTIKYLMHSTQQNLYVYNLTNKDLTFTIPYFAHGKLSHNRPVVLEAYTDKGILGKWYNAIQIRPESRSDMTGIGYAMHLQLLEPATQDEVANFTSMFDLPFKGENSLNTTSDKQGKIEEFYSINEGVNKTGQASASDSAYEIIATYDIVSGEQKDPETGEKGYLYNSLLIIRDKIPA